MLIHIFFGNVWKGPFTVQQVREMLYRGEITFGQPVMIQGRKEQVYLSEIEEFHNDIRQIQQFGIRNAPQPLQSPTPAPKSSSSTALIIVCIILVSCGLCGILGAIENIVNPKKETPSQIASTTPQNTPTAPLTHEANSQAFSATPSGRRQVAKQLQSAFAGSDEVSIYTKGDDDEVLYIGFAGFSARDKSKADGVVDQFRSKVKSYGFKRIEFGDGLRTFWSYGLNE